MAYSLFGINHTPMQRLAPYVLTLLAITLLLFAFGGPRGYPQLKQIRTEAEHLNTKSRELTRQIDEVSGEIRGLERSNYLLEKKAREELGLSRKNEFVYIFPDESRGNN